MDYRPKAARGKDAQGDRDLRRAALLIDELKAVLAAGIVRALARRGLSGRDAHAATGVTAADFSRIRNADLARFTIDRLVSITSKLGSQVELAVKTTRQLRSRGAQRSGAESLKRAGRGTREPAVSAVRHRSAGRDRREPRERAG